MTALGAVSEIDDRAEELDERDGELNDREAEIDEQDAAVRKREKAVGIVEKEIESNTISGEGVYEVGVDMKAGTYKSKGGSGRDCYWSVNTDSNGRNIIANGLSGGPQVSTVAQGQFFETAGCQDWIKQ